MRAWFFAACWLLVVARCRSADDTLTGTWSPDRQIAVSRKRDGDDKWRYCFRHQTTGEDLGNVPLRESRSSIDPVLMRADWNVPGTRVALLIHYGWNAEELRFFSKDTSGRMQPFALTPPDPVQLYRQRKGRPRPQTPDDLAEAGLGAWTDDDTVSLFLGEARPNARNNGHVHYYADFKVRFRGQRAKVTDLQLKAPLTGSAYVNHVLSWTVNYCLTDWSAFGHAPPVTNVNDSKDDLIISHEVISEDSGGWHGLQEACDQYRADFGRFPTGDNRAIMRQLLGLNPKRKMYACLGVDACNQHGEAVDLWHESYVFELAGEHARVFSRRLELIQAEMKNGQRWPATYDSLYYPSKATVARESCYLLALGLRLAVQQESRVLFLPQLLRVLLGPRAGDKEPICDVGDKARKTVLNDPWGAPYQIRLTLNGVSVCSKHLPGEVWTESFTPAP